MKNYKTRVDFGFTFSNQEYINTLRTTAKELGWKEFEESGFLSFSKFFIQEIRFPIGKDLYRRRLHATHKNKNREYIHFMERAYQRLLDVPFLEIKVGEIQNREIGEHVDVYFSEVYNSFMKLWEMSKIFNGNKGPLLDHYNRIMLDIEKEDELYEEDYEDYWQLPEAFNYGRVKNAEADFLVEAVRTCYGRGQVYDSQEIISKLENDEMTFRWKLVEDFWTWILESNKYKADKDRKILELNIEGQKHKLESLQMMEWAISEGLFMRDYMQARPKLITERV